MFSQPSVLALFLFPPHILTNSSSLSHNNQEKTEKKGAILGGVLCIMTHPFQGKHREGTVSFRRPARGQDRDFSGSELQGWVCNSPQRDDGKSFKG